MVIIGYAALAGLGLLYAMMRSPLGRAVGVSVASFADASHRERGELG